MTRRQACLVLERVDVINKGREGFKKRKNLKWQPERQV
jgi:hypothetical protein